MPKNFVGVRLDQELLEHLDGIAKANMLSRSQVIRNLLSGSLYDPYQVMQDASREEFSAAFLGYLVSLNPSSGLDVMNLREWLLQNPYSPRAPKRVRAVVAHYCSDLSSKLRDHAKRLEELAGSPALEKEYEEFMSEERERASHKPEEDIENGDQLT